MILGRVVGSLWATAQHPSFDSVRLVLVVPEDPLTGEVGGPTVLAVDSVGSGSGDTVLVVYEGSSSRQVLADPRTPAEAVVVGIVDRLDSPVARHSRPGFGPRRAGRRPLCGEGGQPPRPSGFEGGRVRFWRGARMAPCQPAEPFHTGVFDPTSRGT